MTIAISHRLDGLEPDNLLAFLALLGLLRSLEADDRERPEEDRARPRAAWDIASPPLRPRLHLALALTPEAIAERADNGLRRLAGSHDFAGRQDINFSQEECRALLTSAAEEARHDARDRVDLLAALMSDAAIKDGRDREVDPTPLCLLFGQGHQHFLDRLASVPLQDLRPPRGGHVGCARSCMQASQRGSLRTVAPCGRDVFVPLGSGGGRALRSATRRSDRLGLQASNATRGQ